MTREENTFRLADKNFMGDSLFLMVDSDVVFFGCPEEKTGVSGSPDEDRAGEEGLRQEGKNRKGPGRPPGRNSEKKVEQQEEKSGRNLPGPPEEPFRLTQRNPVGLGSKIRPGGLRMARIKGLGGHP